MEFNLERLKEGELPLTRGEYKVEWAVYCDVPGLKKPVLVVLESQQPKVLEYFEDGRFLVEGKCSYDLVYEPTDSGTENP